MNPLRSTMITVSSKGQIAIPKEFRIAAGLESGSRLLAEYYSDGTIVLHPASHSINEIFGIAKISDKNHFSFAKNEDDEISAVILEEDEKTKGKKAK